MACGAVEAREPVSRSSLIAAEEKGDVFLAVEIVFLIHEINIIFPQHKELSLHYVRNLILIFSKSQ